MKKYLFFAAVFIGGLQYFFKDKNMTDVHKAIGNPAVQNVKTLSEKREIKERVNKYNIGECYKLSKKNDWEVNKIVKVDVKNKDYYFVGCMKFKGCLKKVEREIIVNFEYDYPASFKIKCP